MKTARRTDQVAMLVLALLLSLAGCAAPSGPAAAPPAIGSATTTAPANTAAPADLAAAITGPAPAKPRLEAVDASCKTDADCTVKNVGNCCGAYPQCVNVDSPTFPEQVKAACAAKGQMGVCGAPSISGCHCVSGTCAALPGPSAPADLK